MPVYRKPVDIPIGQGVETDVHPHHVKAPFGLEALNVVTARDLSYKTRKQYESTGLTPADNRNLIGIDDRVYAVSSNVSTSQNIGDDSVVWTTLNGLGPLPLTTNRFQVADGEVSVIAIRSAAQNGYVLVAYVLKEDTGATFTANAPIYVAVFDATTGGVVRNAAALSGIELSAIVDTRVPNFQVVAHDSEYISIFAKSTAGSYGGCVTYRIQSNGSISSTTAVALSGSPGLATANFEVRGIPDLEGVYAVNTGSAALNVLRLTLSSGSLSIESTSSITGDASELRSIGINAASGTPHIVVVGHDSSFDLTLGTATHGTSLPSSIATTTSYTLATGDPNIEATSGGLTTHATFVHMTLGTQSVLAWSGKPSYSDSIDTANILTQTAVDHGNVVTKWLILSSTGTVAQSTDRRCAGRIMGWPMEDSSGRVLLPISFLRTGAILYINGSGVTEPAEAGQFAVRILPPMSSGGRDLNLLNSDLARLHVSQTCPLPGTNSWAFTYLHDEPNSFLPSLGKAASIGTITYDNYTPNTRFLKSPVLAAGTASMIDDFRHAPLMSREAPFIIAEGEVEANTSGTIGSTVEFVYVWAWKDSNGSIHRSAPSEPFLYTFTDSGGAGVTKARIITIAIPPGWAWKEDQTLGPSEVYLEAYISPYNGADGSESEVRLVDGQYFRAGGAIQVVGTTGTTPNITLDTPVYTGFAVPLSELESSTHPGFSRPIYVSPVTPWTASNVRGVAQPSLYSNTDKTHQPAPPPLSVAATRDRLWIADSEDRTRIWYSAPLNPFESPWFNPDFSIYIPSEGGEVTALGAIRDLLVVFTKEHTYGLTAVEGPDAQGVGVFPPLRKLSDAVSCSNPASIVETDVGLFFQSEYGIYLIGPDGSTNHVGKPVTQLLDSSTIVSSCVLPEDKLVVFDFADGTGLVFDYEINAWTSRNYIGSSLVSSCEAAGRHVILVNNSGNSVYRDTDSVTSESFSSYFSTNWIQLTGSIEGYKRVREIILTGSITGETIPGSPGVNDDAGSVVVTAYYNYDDTDFTTYTRAVLDIVDRNPLRLRIPSTRQKVSSIRIRVAYTQPASSGGTDYVQKLEISGITLGTGLKTGPAKIAPSTP